MKFPLMLRSRLVALVLIAIVPLLLMSFVSAYLMSSRVEADTTKNLEASAILVAANQQRIADSVRQMLTAIAQVPDLVEAKEPFCQNYFKTLTAELKIYTNIGIVGADGYMRCQSSVSSPKLFVGDRPYFQSAMASGEFVGAGYLIGRISAEPVMTFALPIKGADGKTQAVAFAAMLLAEISKTVSAVALPEGGQVVILDREAVVLASSSDKLAQVGKQLGVAAARQAVKAGVARVFEEIDASGNHQIYAFRPSSLLLNSPFFVLVSADKGQMVAPARRQLAFDLAGLALLAVFGSWIAWQLGGKVIVDRVGRVLDVMGRIEAGVQKVRLPVAVDAADNEYTRFARSFNRMADSVEQREQEQKKSYANLSQTQTRLLAAQKLGRIGHWEMDMRSGHLSWSAELYYLFGLTHDDFDGVYATFLKMLHPDDLARYDNQRSVAHANDAELDIEYRIITPAGEVRWMHQQGQVLVSQDGQPILRGGVVQDITARKESEIALTATTERLRRTSELAQVGGWELPLDSMLLTCSDQQLKIHDLPPGTVLTAEAVHKAYPPEARATFISAARAAVSDGTPWDLELPLITSTGRAIWVRTQGRAIFKDGKVVALEGALQDITALHQSREHLRLLESAIERLNDVIVITEAEPVDEPGPQIVFVNGAFERHTGYSREEALGQSPRFLQGPKTQRSELKRITQALKAWQPVRVELINYTKTGEEFWIDMDIVPIANAEGWFTHWVSVQRNITQRKQAERALTSSEQRYAALFEMAPVPMWVFDNVDHRFLAVNRATIENYGYSKAEFLSMTIFDIREESNHASLRSVLLDPSESRPFWQHRRKDGSFMLVNVVAEPTMYQGRDACFVVAIDITAQVKAEKDVQEQLFTLQRAADAAQAIIWHQTLGGMLEEAAEQARGVIGAHQSVISLALGSDRSEVISTLSVSGKYADFTDTHDLPDGVSAYALVCENKRVVRMTQAALEAHPRWSSFRVYGDKYPSMRGWLAVPLTGRDGQNIGLLQLSDKYEGEFTLQDEYVALELAHLASIAIENARLFEQVHQLNAGLEQKVTDRTLALARQEALFRAVAEQAPQVIWTADTAGVTNYFNRAWFDLVGGTPEDWVDRKWSSIMHPEDLDGVVENWKNALATRSAFVGMRRILGADGSYHVMSYRASPVLDEAGEVSFWVGIDADVTEIKTIESALRLSNQELEAFSYSVSHDLRSPLNTIEGFSRLLSKQLTGNVAEKSQHYLSRIQSGVAQMGTLIEDLLSLSQVSRIRLRHEPIDLSALGIHIIDAWRVRQPERNVIVEIEPELHAFGDVRLVRMVLENLIGNAWKFTSQREEAHITIGQLIDAAGSPVFFVRDDGAGFDMAYADKLFVAFQRLHGGAEFAGTGVGLATAGRVIARHSGKIWPEASPDKGATFFFTLPNAPAITSTSGFADL